MASISSVDSLTCKRSDGRGWRCRRPVAEGRSFCETHIRQAKFRQKRQPVPDHLKFQRTPKLEDDAPVRRRKKKMTEPSEGVSVSDAPKSKGKRVKLEIAQAVVKKLPDIKENVKAVAKEKNNKKKTIAKKCHWCKLSTYCVLVKCKACKKNFFCEECINKRLYCKNTIERECPLCQGECPCRACTRGKPKQVKTKAHVIDVDEDVISSDPEMETTVSNRETMSEFEKSLQLHTIRKLLPVISKMNEEKITELDTEAQNRGTYHMGVKVPIVRYTENKECSFCKACIPDIHRSCSYCSFVLCLACCQEFRDGYLQSRIENLKVTKVVRSKRAQNKPWRFYSDGRIRCPPKNLGGCKNGLLNLTSFYALCLTKDLEESAKQILRKFKLDDVNGLSDSSPCMLCDENDEAGFCQLEHFIQHWEKGQPVVVREVTQNQSNWDFGFLLREYLKTSVKSRNNTETGSSNSTREWCEVEFGRKQIFSRGRTHANVWTEFLMFKLQFSTDYLQAHFPDNYNCIIQALPYQEYIHPHTGFMNLGTKNPNLGSYVSLSYGGLDNPLNANLLSNLRIQGCDVVNVLVHASARPIRESSLNKVKMVMSQYNSQDHLKSSKKIAKRNELEGMFASTSRVDDERPSDVNVASTSSRFEDAINHEVDLVSDESESESESESDDEDLSQVGDTCGAHWDIFYRDDAPKLLEYIRKYSDKLSRSNGSPIQVVHPLFDDAFYLDGDHKTRLKEEFDVDAFSVEQHVGEAVIIPAGCPYQMKRIKSCVNVVYEFMSPESAMESIKVSDEVRLLPVNHKAKGNMLQVKKMAISRMQEAIEAMREVFVSHPEWSWPFIVSHSAKLHPLCSYTGVVFDFLQSLR